MKANVLRGILVSALLLPLAILPAHGAIAKQETGFSPLGVVAYIRGGNLWMKELPHGQAERLTTDESIASPRWPPSGHCLAYLKGDQLWVVERSGPGARALEKGGSVSQFIWSPTSDTLAYRTRSGSLWVASAVDWVEREIVSNPGGAEGTGVLSMAWSPDGEWLVYARKEVPKGAEAGAYPELYAGLWRIGADGSGARELFNTGTPAQYGLIVAVWSPDGQRILFWPVPHFSWSLLADGTSLNAIPAHDGEPRQLVPHMLAYSDFLAASPDGKLLAVTEGGGRETWSHKRIVVVDLSSGKSTYLTEDKMTAFSSVWSPDGQHIAYVAAPDIGFVGGGEDGKAGAAQRHIWLMNRDGSEKHELTHDAAYRDERPQWSGDGSHILFARLDESGGASLWLMRADGSELNQMVKELSPAPAWFGYYGHIEWSDYFDWWTDTAPTTLPVTGEGSSVLPEHLVLLIAGTLTLLAGVGLVVLQHKPVPPPPAE